MNLIDKLVPHLIFLAALLPTLLLVAAAAVSLVQPDPSIAIRMVPAQAAEACQPCESPPPRP